MNDPNIQTIEINGIKFDVDLRTAKRVDTFKVGSHVKILLKSANSYIEEKVRPGVVVGFEPFESCPTIIVCYVDISWSEAKLEFAYINAKTHDKYELVMSIDDEISFTKEDVLTRLDREVAKKREEIAEIERKRTFFLEHFNKYFAPEAVA